MVLRVNLGNDVNAVLLAFNHGVVDSISEGVNGEYVSMVLVLLPMRYVEAPALHDGDAYAITLAEYVHLTLVERIRYARVFFPLNKGALRLIVVFGRQRDLNLAMGLQSLLERVLLNQIQILKPLFQEICSSQRHLDTFSQIIYLQFQSH